MSDITITTTGASTILEAPYHPDLPQQAREAGGKWDGQRWLFDARDEQRVREIARSIFGTDGGAHETVTVRYTIDRRQGTRQTLYLAGRQIAHRRRRDAKVILGDGVVVVSGGFPSRGGSMKYPELSPREGTVLEIRDLPADHPDLEKGAVEIIDETTVDTDALRAEKERLETRLAEINRLLRGEQ